ncbi:hypothetical protein COU95_00220 [Candidatus Shapirobacteria bacterium CG10_big_fil_rev_8_21_14_0_10_40_9]|uniref:histidine kinase n=1 Tax=Candidatus Shapirobacteria bacterium CG10_big_fil_rev_8_21_14_0_10_40_9 TaxID=1974888 RepID=A0A2M8L4F5_9BACT|nr:MAG: hypothetical protein COU95_00220 [Candidatus Shapirobacteria bacterium CG10_big_fil_rev_8_21_14_0_10_40_9]
MFKSARLKLTGWYLVIIMTISLTFSAVIYKGVTFEFGRRLNIIERRLIFEERIPRSPIGPQPFFIEDLEEARKRVLFILFYANGAILIFSGLAGYLLAGKTLRPIERTLEEQKRFVADASHEMRTPLTALKTSMEVALRDKKISLSGAKKVIKSNLEDIDGLQTLSNNLLSLANYQSNGQSLVFGSVEMAEVVKSAYRKILPLAKKKGIEINLKVKKQKVKGNKESLEQMMLIFLDNAVKYTPRGGQVWVETKQDRRNLIIKIKDNGIGISQKDIPHVFERFYRVDQSRSKDNVAGFGLGLSLAKRIIEIHKGTVKVSSVLGKGTTFTVLIPF